jgi:hypothetical protein
MTHTLAVSAVRYSDNDDSLSAAAKDFVEAHPSAEGWALNPRWEDDDRDMILLDVPPHLHTLDPEPMTRILDDYLTQLGV